MKMKFAMPESAVALEPMRDPMRDDGPCQRNLERVSKRLDAGSMSSTSDRRPVAIATTDPHDEAMMMPKDFGDE